MRYLLVDRILEWQPGSSIRGVKGVAMSEDFLEFHFPKNPVMPGLLLLEAMVQLAGWLEAASSDFSNWVLLQKVDRCMFYGFTLPGDSVDLQVQASAGAAAATKSFGGTCSVNGKKKVVAEFTGAIVSLDHIEEVEEQKKFFQILTRSEYMP